MAFVSTAFSLRSATGRRNSVCTRPISSRTSRRLVPNCTSSAPNPTTETSTTPEEELPPIKLFLNSLGPLGRCRLVMNNGAAVLESIAPLDKLFYAHVRGAEYGNVIDHSLNVDLHLKVDAIYGARFEIGKSRTNPPVPTYAIRLLGADKEVKISIFVQWDVTPSDVEPERIEAWKSLKERFAGADEHIAWFKTD